jgi:hypothetical protein
MTSEIPPLNIKPHPNFPERARRFYESYQLMDIVGVGDQRYSKRILRGYTSRTCLFCGRSYPEAPFKTYAHFAPQLIGNSNLYSDFECDECNQRFSALEGDLASFIGISRSIVGMGNEKKTVGFKGRRFTAKSRSFMGENILIIAPEDIETINGTSTLKYTKNPFSAFSVYKSLLKPSLSLLGPEYVTEHCRTALDILMGRLELTNGLVMSGYRLSLTTNLPFHVYRFRKKNPNDKIHTDVFLYHFQNQIIAFPVPLHGDDRKLIGSDFQGIFPPPYFTNDDNMKFAQPVEFLRDFSTKQLVENEEESIGIKLDDSVLENLVAYDRATGEFAKKPFGQNKTKYIILTKPGMTADPKELSDFIEKELEGEC